MFKLLAEICLQFNCQQNCHNNKLCIKWIEICVDCHFLAVVEINQESYNFEGFTKLFSYEEAQQINPSHFTSLGTLSHCSIVRIKKRNCYFQLQNSYFGNAIAYSPILHYFALFPQRFYCIFLMHQARKQKGSK